MIALALSRQRGEDLILGGIFDHVGGGFHRYTVDQPGLYLILKKCSTIMVKF